MISVKALFFDVFGTLVDFRTGVAREAETILGAAGHRRDWLAFADAWREEYQPAMDEIAPAARRSVSSMYCTGATSIAFCRGSGLPIFPKPRRAISISRGTGFPPGPTCLPALLASSAAFCWRRSRMAIFR
jgi:hypothetical protein